MELAFDTPTRTAPAELKTGGPRKEPPAPVMLDRNPRRHDVVAWRNDGRLASWQFETKERAAEFGATLDWVNYYQWALMDGRNMIEKHAIAIPAGMALDDNGLPCKAAA